MKIGIECLQCACEGVRNYAEIEQLDWNDEGKYRIQCPKGHSSITLILQQKYELLFEIGVHAIADGYYREAVSSFTSSLERFYEFFIKVMSLSKGTNWEQIQDAWKCVSNQSERQLGAFVFLYLQDNKTAPKLLHNKRVEFRNAVIHKGKIPSKDEAIEYGQAILDLVRPMIRMIKENYESELNIMVSKHIHSKRTEDELGLMIATANLPTVLNLHQDDPFHAEMTLRTVLGFSIFQR